MKTRYAMSVLLLAVMAVAAWTASPGQTPAPRTPDKNGVIKGYRGVSIPLSGHQLAFVNKGNRVDALVTFEAQMADRKEKVTATILQNVVVVNVIRPGKLGDAGVVELLLNPNEAQYAALAMHQGDIHLSVRAEGDTKMEPMEMASFRKLFK
ncbi:MAG: RcpC/CpaB family pilus assembly protein [Elusimicrobia bacterium]|nr:RcpC/CpaB family pilus assembly protein [Elusimicrobiota bacterium]